MTDAPALVLLGTTPILNDLRRTLAARGEPVVGVSTHLRGLRSALAVRNDQRFILVVAIERATLERYGALLRRLLADYSSANGPVRCVGLLDDAGLSAEAATLGCDLYVSAPSACSEQLADLVRCVAQHSPFVQTYNHVNRLSALLASDADCVHGRIADVSDRKA